MRCQRVVAVSPERTGGTAGGGVVGRRLGAVMNISRVIDLQQSLVYALLEIVHL